MGKTHNLFLANRHSDNLWGAKAIDDEIGVENAAHLSTEFQDLFLLEQSNTHQIVKLLLQMQIQSCILFLF